MDPGADSERQLMQERAHTHLLEPTVEFLLQFGAHDFGVTSMLPQSIRRFVRSTTPLSNQNVTALSPQPHLLQLRAQIPEDRLDTPELQLLQRLVESGGIKVTGCLFLPRVAYGSNTHEQRLVIWRRLKLRSEYEEISKLTGGYVACYPPTTSACEQRHS